MPPLIPLLLLLLGIASVSAAFGLSVSQTNQRTTLLARQDKLVAEQDRMIEERDQVILRKVGEVARKDQELATMGGFVKTLVARVRRLQEGGDEVAGIGVADGGVRAAVEAPRAVEEVMPWLD